MTDQPQQPDRSNEEDQLFDEIRSYLASQSGANVYEDLRSAFTVGKMFTDRELRKMEEFPIMVRALERLVEDEFPEKFDASMRNRLAEAFYIYGLAHYSLLHQADETTSEQEETPPEGSRTDGNQLLIYDMWFPQDVAVEQAQEGYYMHLSDGRIDLSLYLGETLNDRGVLVDLVDHWGFAAVSGKPQGELKEESDERIMPLLTLEMDYHGSELIDADDHVDVIFINASGDPVVRVHARPTDLRLVIDELQSIEDEKQSDS